jgi:hypothetical protein
MGAGTVPYFTYVKGKEVTREQGTGIFTAKVFPECVSLILQRF